MQGRQGLKWKPLKWESVFQPHRLLVKGGLGPGALPYQGETALTAGGDLSLAWAVYLPCFRLSMRSPLFC